MIIHDKNIAKQRVYTFLHESSEMYTYYLIFLIKIKGAASQSFDTGDDCLRCVLFYYGL